MELGHLNDQGGKEGVWVEGRASSSHTHNDGTRGRDVYAAKVSYQDGKSVGEKNAGWGHTQERGSRNSGK